MFIFILRCSYSKAFEIIIKRFCYIVQCHSYILSLANNKYINYKRPVNINF